MILLFVVGGGLGEKWGGKGMGGGGGGGSRWW